MSIESPPVPASEWGMRPPPGLATAENELYQTASSDSDVSGPVDVDNPVVADVAAMGLFASLADKPPVLAPNSRQPPPLAPTAAATGLTYSGFARHGALGQVPPGV